MLRYHSVLTSRRVVQVTKRPRTHVGVPDGGGCARTTTTTTSRVCALGQHPRSGSQRPFFTSVTWPWTQINDATNVRFFSASAYDDDHDDEVAEETTNAVLPYAEEKNRWMQQMTKTLEKDSAQIIELMKERKPRYSYLVQQQVQDWKQQQQRQHREKEEKSVVIPQVKESNPIMNNEVQNNELEQINQTSLPSSPSLPTSSSSDSLMDLLHDNDDNGMDDSMIKSSPSSSSPQVHDKTDDYNSEKMKASIPSSLNSAGSSSLMDLLDDVHDSSADKQFDAKTSDGVETHSHSLLDLLDDDQGNYANKSNTTFKSSTGLETHSKSFGGSKSLLDLLDDDEADFANKSTETPTFSAKMETRSNSMRGSKSLLDLLHDDEDDYGNTSTEKPELTAKVETRSNSTGDRTLLDLLNDDDLFSPREQTLSNSREIHYNDKISNKERSKKVSQTEVNKNGLSLLDLLNDDDVIQKPADTQEKAEEKEIVDRSELLDLLCDTPKYDNGNSSDNTQVEKGISDDSNNETVRDGRTDTKSRDDGQFNFEFDDIFGSPTPPKPNPTNEQSVMENTLALQFLMTRKDWSQVESLQEVEDDTENEAMEQRPEDIMLGVQEEVVNLESVNDEQESNEIYFHEDGFQGSESEFDDLETAMDEDEDPFDDVRELLKGSSTGKWTLTTQDFNMLLLRIATSNDCNNNDVRIEWILTTYRQMLDLSNDSSSSSSAPNATTYAILMIALQGRGMSPSSAIDFCMTMMEREPDPNQGSKKEDSFVLNGPVVEVAMRCLGEQNRIEDADKLFQWAMRENNSVLNTSVFCSLLEMYKRDNRRSEALDLVKQCIQEENRSCDSSGVDDFLVCAIDWPRRSRDGKMREIVSIYRNMLNIILASCEDGFEPTFKVWQKLIIASSHVARTEATWEIVRKACVGMLKYLPSSFPDSRLLKIGLDAAEKTGDADLAAEFLSRMWNMQQQMDAQGVDFSASEIDTPGDADKKLEDSVMVWKVPETLRSRPMRRHVNVPPQAILKTIGLCVELGELERAQSLLNLCCSSQNQTNNSRIPDSTRRQMYNVVIAGYAQKGDFDNAHDLLTTMQTEGPKPSEHSYAAVLHSLAVQGKKQKANSILNGMRTNEYGDGVKPGASCYSAVILSAMQSGDWSYVLDLRNDMRSDRVPSCKASFQGEVLAWSRLGNREKVMDTIEHSSKEGGLIFDEETFRLCTKLLLPENTLGIDVPDARQLLRQMGQEQPLLESTTLELGRSLRNAEREMSRALSKKNTEQTRAEKRNKSWAIVLHNLVGLVRVMDKLPSSSATNIKLHNES